MNLIFFVNSLSKMRESDCTWASVGEKLSDQRRAAILTPKFFLLIVCCARWLSTPSFSVVLLSQVYFPQRRVCLSHNRRLGNGIRITTLIMQIVTISSLGIRSGAFLGKCFGNVLECGGPRKSKFSAVHIVVNKIGFAFIFSLIFFNSLTSDADDNLLGLALFQLRWR